MTPRELELAHRGYRLKMDEQKELIRMQAFYIMSPHVKQNSLKPNDLIFPGDKQKKEKSKKIKIRKIGN